jgi:hypothetical protein
MEDARKANSRCLHWSYPPEDGRLVVRWICSLVRLHLIESLPDLLRDARIDLDGDMAVAIWA